MKSPIIQQYLESKRNAWSPKTKKNVEQYLRVYGEAALKMFPEDFFDSLGHLKPYSKKTIWIAVTGLYGWVNKEKENVYDLYRKVNRYAFKGVYQRKEVEITYEEFEERLRQEPEGDCKALAYHFLKSAHRWSEGQQSGSTITGKGNKTRSNLGEHRGAVGQVGYFTFYRWLRSRFNISPHTIRKLALSKAADRGATAADLCAIAGWSSIAPAYNYLLPKDTERLKAFLK